MTARAHAVKAGAGLLVAGLLVYSLARPDVQAPPAPQPKGDAFGFVRSMDGTRPDGEIREDGAGELVVDAELGRLFDYYLAGLGEKDLAAIRMQIERELDARLGKQAAVKAKRLLASYLDYKRALVDVERTQAPGGDLARAVRARMAALRKLRADYFSEAEIAGLFGAQDAYDDDALARLEVSQDKALTAAQLSERLAALDRAAPASVREEREAPARVFRAEEAAQQLRAQGGSEDDVYRMRAAAFSPEAANRLAELDREQADWQRRIASYQAARKDGGDLQKVRDSLFTTEEQKRLRAYE